MSLVRWAMRTGSCRVLGPGTRAVLWVYGCCFDCKGCLAKDFREGPYKEGSVRELAEWFLEQDRAEGLTISGGEPMLQADALADLVEEIRKEKDWGLIVYTGFVYEDLLKKEDPGIQRFLSLIDILIDGPYVKELDTGKPYVGSENQKIRFLSERYKRQEDYYTKTMERQTEYRLEGNEILMFGVPGEKEHAAYELIKAASKLTGGPREVKSDGRISGEDPASENRTGE